MHNHWFDNEIKKWHEFRILSDEYTYTEFFYLFDEIVIWIQQNLDKPYRHVRWILTENGIYVKFRYERDYLRFVLRWS